MRLLACLTLITLAMASINLAIAEETEKKEDEEVLKCDKPFVLDGNISQSLTGEVYEKLIPCLTAGHEQELIINSNGGEAWTAYGLYDALRIANTENKLTTKIIGQGHSAAVILFLAADRREISCGSSMLLHKVKMTVRMSTDNEQNLINLAESHEQAQQRYVEIVAERTKISPKGVKELMNQEKYRRAKEVLALGIATKVIGCE